MKKTAHNPLDTAHARAAAIYKLLSSNPTRAWKEARSALKTFPRSERVQFVTGLVLISQGKKPQARVQFANAIKLGTPTPDAYINLAQLSAETDKLDFAIDTLDRAQERFPDNLQILIARVNVFRIVGDAPRALEATTAALSAHPSSVEALLLHGLLLSENGRLLNAITTLENLLDDSPNHVVALINLGRFYAFTNQPSRGLEVTERAYKLSPTMPSVVENLAIRKRENGDFLGAVSSFRELITLSPEFSCEALRQLADIAAERELIELSKDIELHERKARSPEDKAQLGFARAAVAKRVGDAQSFTKALKQANRLTEKLRPYDAQSDSQLHVGIRKQYRAESPAELSHPDLPAVPIFVMGMPRSGTTLLERMLTLAPNVVGLGEVALINRHMARNLAASTPINNGLPDLRSEYARFQNLAGYSNWTVDKMPANYMHMGWINRAFPEAKLILLRRDVKDLALSLFENYFDDAGQNFSFDETGIKHRMDLFDETIADWSSLGVKFLELSYEDLVRNPEDSLRKVCGYCGFPFSSEMLKPESNHSSIRTASSVQARREVNQDSLARWKNYPDMLPSIFH